MIAQYGDNDPAVRIGTHTIPFMMNAFGRIGNRILMRSDRPEKMVARIIILSSKIVVREMTNG